MVSSHVEDVSEQDRGKDSSRPTWGVTPLPPPGWRGGARHRTETL